METTSDPTVLQFSRARRVRMAYALNNEQPVRCTLIGDQPLFYMDFESAVEDEGDFLLALEEDQLAEKLTVTRDAAPVLSDGQTARRMADFQSDMLYATAAAGVMAESCDHAFEMALLTRTLEKSRLAKSFIDIMRLHDGWFVINDEVETAAYDRSTGNIQINPNRPHAELVLLAARELRRLWQHRNGALIDPLNFHPDQAILVNRAQIADLTASMVRTAWELQLAGVRDMWDRIENSSMEDLGRAFAREAFMDFRTVNNGTANCAVFEAWFLSERCCHEDRKLIQQMLANYNGYTFDSNASSVVRNLISVLGAMPFGKNYLQAHTQTVLNDVLFTEVRDRSNANFLWFIKFERSFRDTETDLRGENAKVSGNDREQSSGKTTKRFGDHETTADIIALPDGRTRSEHAPGPASRPLSGGARIVPFKGSLPRGGRAAE